MPRFILSMTVTAFVIGWLLALAYLLGGVAAVLTSVLGV